MTKVIEFVLNYIFIPIILILFVAWEVFSRLFSDVWSHLYGKILVPFLALLVFTLLLSYLFDINILSILNL